MFFTTSLAGFWTQPPLIPPSTPLFLFSHPPISSLSFSPFISELPTLPAPHPVLSSFSSFLNTPTPPRPLSSPLTLTFPFLTRCPTPRHPLPLLTFFPFFHLRLHSRYLHLSQVPSLSDIKPVIVFFFAKFRPCRQRIWSLTTLHHLLGLYTLRAKSPPQS